MKKALFLFAAFAATFAFGATRALAQASCSGLPAFATCSAYANGAAVTFGGAKYTAIAPIPATRDCPPNSPYDPSTDNWWTNNGTCSGGATATATRAATATATTVGATATATRTATATAVGATNLALNKAATGSASCAPNETPDKAVNGSVSGGNADKWCGNTAPLWMQVDLGASATISSFTVRHAGAGGESTTLNTRDFNIQTSTDNVTWTTVVTVAGNTANVSSHAITSRAARYVKLNVTAASQGTDTHARIYELEVYGTGGGATATATRAATATATATRTATATATRTPTSAQPAPPATWQEHWFEHVQLMKLQQYNDTVALYFDNDVNPSAATWMMPYLTSMWQYAQNTYGNLNQTRLFSLHHEGKYFGGHPSYWYDASHDFRNVSDVGGSNWTTPQYEVATHESGHVVESVASGKKGSPPFGIWGDSKWMEFYIYDIYVSLGMTTQANDVFTRFTNTTDTFPRAGTHWFRDWFYPLWRDHGHAQVMVRFFRLEGQYFPTDANGYFTRGMNMGEFVHFMSGAAQTNLKAQATTAFGWTAQNDTDFNNARAQFPQITY